VDNHIFELKKGEPLFKNLSGAGLMPVSADGVEYLIPFSFEKGKVTIWALLSFLQYLDKKIFFLF